MVLNNCLGLDGGRDDARATLETSLLLGEASCCAEGCVVSQQSSLRLVQTGCKCLAESIGFVHAGFHVLERNGQVAMHVMEFGLERFGHSLDFT